MSLERVWSCDVYRAGDGVHRAWLARRRKFELPLERFVRGLNRKHRDILQLEEALLANRGAGRVIVNSQMVKTEIVDLYGYPADKIDIVRNGVPIGQFRFDPKRREESRDQLKVKPDEIALLFAGSGWERKGLRFAIAAMALCNNRKMRLLVAGRGNQRYYKSKHVRFLGEVPDPVRIYSAADIFILPTIYDPFSNACLEALACGLPVITTRSNGFSEIIEHEVHGSIVDFANNVVGIAGRNSILVGAGTACRGKIDKYATCSAVRYFRECRPDFGDSSSGCGQRCVHVWKNLKHLIKPRDFENGADRFLQAGQRELAAVGFDLLHSFDKRRQARAVDVSDAGKIDYQLLRFFPDHGV